VGLVSPARHNPYDGEPPDTLLARARLSRGVTQEELAEAVGVSAQTIRRLERGEVENPKLRTLVNCALALGVDLSDVLEDDWLAWLPMNGAEEPPEPDEFWRRPYRPAR
jgi:transcriptional regulator with XRE-family HTH domain